MTRLYQSGDFVDIFEDLRESRLIISSITNDGIYVHHSGKINQLSLIILTSDGWKLKGGETRPFKFVFKVNPLITKIDNKLPLLPKVGYIVDVIENGRIGQFIINNVLSDGIYVNPKEHPESNSLIYLTTDGFKFLGGESRSFIIEFKKPLEEIFKPNVIFPIGDKLKLHIDVGNISIDNNVSDIINTIRSLVKGLGSIQLYINGIKLDEDKSLKNQTTNSDRLDNIDMIMTGELIKIGDKFEISSGDYPGNIYTVSNIGFNKVYVVSTDDSSEILTWYPTGWKLFGPTNISWKIKHITDNISKPISLSPTRSLIVEKSTDQYIEIKSKTPETISFDKLSLNNVFITQLNTEDLDEMYHEFIYLNKFDFRSVKDWIDNPKVRINLMRTTIDISQFPFSDKYSHTSNIHLNSPNRENLIDYIIETVIPNYIDQTSLEFNPNKALILGNPESDIIYTILQGILGYLVPSDADIYYIFEHIFPSLQITKVPDDGDCYYSSIGEKMEFDSTRVRNDISNQYKLEDIEERQLIVQNAISICPADNGYGQMYRDNRDELVNNFSTFIINKCGNGRFDCNGCIWGGNFLDEIVSKVYQRPVVSVNILTESNGDIVLNLMSDIKDKHREYLKQIMMILNPLYWNNIKQTFTFDVITRTIAITITPNLHGLDEDTLMNSKTYISYILSAGKHVDAII